MEKTTDTNALLLPTHGGLYEFDPASKTMKAVEGGPPQEEPAPAPAQPLVQTPDETTGDQA